MGAQTVGNSWNGLAARMEQAEHPLRFLEQSQRTEVFRQTIAREPLENREHRPRQKLEEPLTWRHESV